MIGTRIESVPKFPVIPLLLMFCGAGMLAISLVSQEVGWVVGSVPFWTVAVALYLIRPKPFSVMITSDGLEHGDFGESIPYSSIEAIIYQGTADPTGRPADRQMPLLIQHEQGMLTIPKTVCVSTGELYQFLCGRFQPRATFELNPLLQQYADEQTEVFGEDKVFQYTARRVLEQKSGNVTARAVGAALFLAGLSWFFAGGLSDGWIGGAIALVITGLVTCLAGFTSGASAKKQIRNWQSSALVVTPVGLALIQGPLKGRLRWNELRDVKLNARDRSFRLSSASVLHGLRLEVEGSSIVIADIYNEPLPMIHQRIMSYWRGDESP